MNSGVICRNSSRAISPISVGGEIRLAFPDRHANDLTAAAQDLVQDASLLLLFAMRKLAQHLPGFLFLSWLDFAAKQSCVHRRFPVREMRVNDWTATGQLLE